MPSIGSSFSDAFIKKLSNKDYRDAYAADQARLRLAMQIRTLREQRGLTQAQLGELIGKPQSVISRLEDPDYGKVSLQTVLEVAEGFDLPVYVDLPEWPDWFRLMNNFGQEKLRRSSFSVGQLQSTNEKNVRQSARTSASKEFITISATTSGKVVTTSGQHSHSANLTLTGMPTKEKTYA